VLGRAGSPSPPPQSAFQSFKKLPDKTNKYNCFLLGNAACSNSIFIKPGRREGKKALEEGLCEGTERQREEGRAAVPSPRPGGSGDAPAPPAFAPLPRQRFRSRAFRSAAAVPHHANAVTERDVTMAKASLPLTHGP